MGQRRANLSEQVRRALDDSGLSRYAVCKLTGIDKGHMSRFMSGQGALSMENLDALGRLLLLRITANGKPTPPPKMRPGRKRKNAKGKKG
ncbi:MAG: hypothetical protein ACE15C_03845 [Phycisphaerae bacterium]